MIESTFLHLVYNTALLLMLVFIFDFFVIRWQSSSILRHKIPTGVIIGLMGIILIETHWTLDNGVIFDTRSILIGMSGLYFGFIPTIVAMVITSVFRLFEGGIGAFTGILSILASGIIGIAWRHYRKKEFPDYSLAELYLFGFTIHIVLLLLLFTLPNKEAITTIKSVALPIMLIFPAGTALLGVFMSHRLQREKLIRKVSEEETKLKIIADHTTDWDYWLSPQGKFIYCSASCLRITGYPDHQFYNDSKLLERIIYEEDRDKMTRYLNRDCSAGPGHMEFRFVHHDGEIRWANHSCLPIFDNTGKFLGTRGTVRNITAQKESELKIREKNDEISQILSMTENSRRALLSVVEDQKIAQQELAHLNEELEQRVEDRTALLTAANRELEAFSYSVSHDLRAPLRGIAGFTEILVNEYGAKLGSEGEQLCSVIRENTIKMGKLIEDLLSFSRLSRKEIHKSEIDMKSMFNSMYFEITTPDERKNINLKIGDLGNCHGDTSMMRLVVANLLSNAIKYSSGKSPQIIEVFGNRDEQKLVYFVKDNGVGFDMRYKDKLFGVFQRLHSTSEFEGTGVGLANVQRIIHRHEGEVGAESTIGEGATFWFSVPMQPGQDRQNTKLKKGTITDEQNI